MCKKSSRCLHKADIMRSDIKQGRLSLRENPQRGFSLLLGLARLATLGTMPARPRTPLAPALLDVNDVSLSYIENCRVRLFNVKLSLSTTFLIILRS